MLGSTAVVLIVSSLDFRTSIIDVSILSSVTEIAFEPIKCYSSDAKIIYFGNKNIMIDSVKGFLHVYEDTRDKVSITKSICYHFCEANDSMIS